MKKTIALLFASLLLIAGCTRGPVEETTPEPTVYTLNELAQFRKDISDDLIYDVWNLSVDEVNSHVSVNVIYQNDDYVTYFGDVIVNSINACTSARIDRKYLTVSLYNNKGELYFIFTGKEDSLGFFIDNRDIKPRSFAMDDYENLVDDFPATTLKLYEPSQQESDLSDEASPTNEPSNPNVIISDSAKQSVAQQLSNNLVGDENTTCSITFLPETDTFLVRQEMKGISVFAENASGDGGEWFVLKATICALDNAIANKLSEVHITSHVSVEVYDKSDLETILIKTLDGDVKFDIATAN